MFGNRYFAPRYFPDSYYPPGATAVVAETASGGRIPIRTVIRPPERIVVSVKAFAPGQSVAIHASVVDPVFASIESGTIATAGIAGRWEVFTGGVAISSHSTAMISGRSRPGLREEEDELLMLGVL